MTPEIVIAALKRIQAAHNRGSHKRKNIMVYQLHRNVLTVLSSNPEKYTKAEMVYMMELATLTETMPAVWDQEKCYSCNIVLADDEIVDHLVAHLSPGLPEVEKPDKVWPATVRVFGPLGDQMAELEPTAPMFGGPACLCRPWTRQDGVGRYLEPGESITKVCGWELNVNCPSHGTRTTR